MGKELAWRVALSLPARSKRANRDAPYEWTLSVLHTIFNLNVNRPAKVHSACMILHICYIPKYRIDRLRVPTRISDSLAYPLPIAKTDRDGRKMKRSRQSSPTEIRFAAWSCSSDSTTEDDYITPLKINIHWI